MDVIIKKVGRGRDDHHWFYPAAAPGESEYRRGVVVRDYLMGGWWARVGGHDQKGRGNTKKEAIEDAETLVYGNSCADQFPEEV